METSDSNSDSRPKISDSDSDSDSDSRRFPKCLIPIPIPIPEVFQMFDSDSDSDSSKKWNHSGIDSDSGIESCITVKNLLNKQAQLTKDVLSYMHILFFFLLAWQVSGSYIKHLGHKV